MYAIVCNYITLRILALRLSSFTTINAVHPECNLVPVSVSLRPQLGFFEVWLTRITGLSTPDRIMFEDGTIFTHAQLATIYDVSTTIIH